jgi:hypothetical protein
LVEEACNVEDIIASKKTKNTYIRSSLWRVKKSFYARSFEFVQWLWFCYLRLIACRILAIAMLVLSLAVVWGESTLFIDATISVFPLILQYDYNEIDTQLLCLCPFIYIVLSSYIPLFQLKLKGRYGLYNNNHTDPANLIWSACFMARLIPALSYNFLLLTKVEGTQFRSVMKVVDLVPYLGLSFAEFFPLLLIIFCLLNAFNVHTRLFTALGLAQLTFTEALDKERIVEGKSLIAKARLVKEKQVREANSYLSRMVGRTDTEESKGKQLKRPLREK